MSGHSQSDRGADARRLVLGAAVGYGIPQICVFMESLRQSGYRGDGAMLVRWPNLRASRYLRRHGFEALQVFHMRSVTRSISARRYAIYLDYLRPRADRYDQVMLTDVRDVVFQANPFDGLPATDCHFFLESRTRTIAQEPLNWGWAKACYGERADIIANCPISCAGVTIGRTAAIIDYLEHMVGQIATMPLRIYRRVGHGYDQGIHNMLVHTSPDLAKSLVENNVHVTTMALEPRESFAVDRTARIRASDGRIYPICHQYDRFPDIKAVVEARFPPTP